MLLISKHNATDPETFLVWDLTALFAGVSLSFLAPREQGKVGGDFLWFPY